jgi:hypothetical protein
MIDIIQKKVKNILYDCCEKYAKKQNISIDNVQIILGMELIESDEDVMPKNTYTLCQNYVKKDNYDILKVLGVPFDLLGYGNMAEPFIMKSLVRFSQEHNVDFENIGIMCVPFKNGKKNDVALFLYNGNEYIPTKYKVDEEEMNGISFEDLFRVEDLDMQTE